ncbi:MAG: formylglycine-generating enzyme family protein [Myxococcales bacterium]|nr:formylglycine-generating enzyme family protein [Myxococcales bacterium]
MKKNKYSILLLLLFIMTIIACNELSDDDDNDDNDNDNDNDDNDNDDNDNNDDDSTDIVDANGITWKFIPGGEFMMGCSPNDEMCSSDEKPAHKIILSSFRMSETEITYEQYRLGTGDLGIWDPCMNCGVRSLTWYDANEFCEQVGGRLPTEAEWEYAARGGTTTRYYCGDDPFCLGDIAWFDWNGREQHPVKEKDPNQYGLYDMLGNMEEFVADYYYDDYYQESPVTNPSGPENGSNVVIRGGYYGSSENGLRVSRRDRVSGRDFICDDLVTIRCVMEVQ